MTICRRVISVVLSSLMLLAACGGRQEPDDAPSAAPATVMSTTPSTTTSQPATTTTRVVQPQRTEDNSLQTVAVSTSTTAVQSAPIAQASPQLPTCDFLAPMAGFIGTISIPKIGLEQPLYEGAIMEEILEGPGHCPGSALPGQPGDMLIAGHRTTRSAPFLRMNELVPGDQIIFVMNDGHQYVYQVEKDFEVLDWTDLDGLLAGQTSAPRAKLFACHPPGSADYRIVVTATLVSSI